VEAAIKLKALKPVIYFADPLLRLDFLIAIESLLEIAFLVADTLSPILGFGDTKEFAASIYPSKYIR